MNYRLLCPGPVNVTSAVRRAVAGPDLCHREPEFSALLAGVRRKLAKAFGVTATHAPVIISGSGTAALESAVLASVRPGRKLLVIDNGVYGARIAHIATLYRIPVVAMKCPMLEPIDLAQIEAKLRRDTMIDTVAVVHHETSTGVLNPVAQIAAMARRAGKAVLVDAISSIGAEAVPLTQIDLCVGSAGKCLHGYPGLSFVFVAKRFVPRMTGPPRSLYLDLRTALTAQEAGEPPFTPAVPLIQAFDIALDELLRQGVPARIRKYRARAAFLRRGFDRLGLQPLAPRALQCHSLTALRLPAGVTYDRLHDAMKREGYVIYAGQSQYRRTMFRIAHLGALSRSDVSGVLRALRRALAPRGARR